MALATRPSVLLLDEPTAGLSNAETSALTDLVRTFPADLTVLIIEHDLGVIFDLTDQLTVLQNGVVIADGPSGVIREDPIVKKSPFGPLEPPLLTISDRQIYSGIESAYLHSARRSMCHMGRSSTGLVEHNSIRRPRWSDRDRSGAGGEQHHLYGDDRSDQTPRHEHSRTSDRVDHTRAARVPQLSPSRSMSTGPDGSFTIPSRAHSILRNLPTEAKSAAGLHRSIFEQQTVHARDQPHVDDRPDAAHHKRTDRPGSERC